LISIQWRCEECGETEEAEHDPFATINQIILDTWADHRNRSPYCESQSIFVGMPVILLDPGRGYAMRHENGHSTEPLPLEGGE